MLYWFWATEIKVSRTQKGGKIENKRLIKKKMVNLLSLSYNPWVSQVANHEFVRYVNRIFILSECESVERRLV